MPLAEASVVGERSVFDRVSVWENVRVGRVRDEERDLVTDPVSEMLPCSVPDDERDSVVE